MSDVPNAIVEHLRRVALRYAITAGIMLAVSVFAAWRRRPLLGAGLPPVFMTLFALVPLFALIGLAWALRLVQSPLEHPTLRALERAAPGARKRLLNAFDKGEFVIARGPLGVSREAAALLQPWGFEARFMDDLAWVHPTLSTVTSAGIVLRSDLLITLRYRKAKELALGVSQSELEALTQMLSHHWPRVVVGWSEEREKLWRQDREQFGTHHTV